VTDSLDLTGWRSFAPGERVVVRRRLSDDESAAARAAHRGSIWTDILAVVRSVSDDGLALVTDSPRQYQAREVWVPADQIETAKRIPPRPVRRGDSPGL
jgi:hypothetical protein